MSSSSSAIESVLVENRVFYPSDAMVQSARISGMDGYHALCKAAEDDFEGFWAQLARDNVVWNKPFTRTLDESNAPFYKWFDDGELNASANCLDKHMGTQENMRTKDHSTGSRAWPSLLGCSNVGSSTTTRPTATTTTYTLTGHQARHQARPQA